MICLTPANDITLRTGFERRVKRDVVERGGARLGADRVSGFPAVIDIGQAEQAANHPRFRVLGAAAEKLVVVEVEIDDFAVTVDREAGDVMADIAVPALPRAPRIVDRVAAIAVGRRQGLRGFKLLDTQRIGAERSAFVAVPEPDDQLHQQIAVDAMALPDRLLRELRCRLPRIDVNHLTQRLLPELPERLLVGETRRRLGRGLRRRRSAEAPCQCRGARSACRCHDHVSPINFFVGAHRCFPPQFSSASAGSKHFGGEYVA
jgi:hypothetical protein